MGLLKVVVYAAASKLECQTQSGQATTNSPNQTGGEASGDVQRDPSALEPESSQEHKAASAQLSASDGKRSIDTCSIFLQLPQSDLRNLCSLLGCEGYYSGTGFYI